MEKTIVSNQSPDEAEIYFDLGIGKSEPYDRRPINQPAYS